MELDLIKKIVAQVMGTDPETITADTSFADDLGADSLDLFQIIMAIEEQFEIEINDEDAMTVTTVGDAADMIVKIGGTSVD